MRSKLSNSKLLLPTRRLFVTGAAGLALAGCDRIAATKTGQAAFKGGSALTYGAINTLDGGRPVPGELSYQAARTMGNGAFAPEYAASEISPIFKPNGSLDPKDPAYRKLAAERFASYALPVGGLVAKPRTFTLADLKGMPARTQVTRHDCVEGWSCIGQWTGVPLHAVLDLVEPRPEARYVVFHCFDRYDTDYTTDPVDPARTLEGNAGPVFYGSIGMDAAAHPQTILAYGMNGRDLPVSYGAPLRLRLERQLGYKMTKYIKGIELVASFANIGEGHGGYWEDQGYQWYAGT